jgi:hypothetical protein
MRQFFKGKNMKFGKKGVTFADLPNLALLFVVGGIILGIGAYVLSQVQTTAGWAATTTEYLAVSNATSGIANLSNWYPIIGVVLAASVVIAVIVGAFVVRGRGV